MKNLINLLKNMNESLKSKESILETKLITQGVVLVDGVLFGYPPEIIKKLHQMGEKTPRIFVTPDIIYDSRGSHANPEFPYFTPGFKEGAIFKGEKIIFVGTREQNERTKKTLQLVSRGFDSVFEYTRRGIDKEYATTWYNLTKDMAVPSFINKGEKANIEEHITFIEYDDQGEATVGNKKIIRLGNNKFKILDESGKEAQVDLNFEGTREPILPIPKLEKPINRCNFGITELGSANGFDKNGYTSGTLIHAHGNTIAVDGPGNFIEHMKALGLAPDATMGHIITHIHGDHIFSIIDIMRRTRKMHIITTKLIYEMLVYKISLDTDLPENKIKDMIEYHEIIPGKTFSWYGADFECWDTCHSIPTIGFSCSVDGEKIVFSGDTKYGSQLDSHIQNGTLPQEWADQINSVPKMDALLINHDGGGGMIHPIPSELLGGLTSEQRARIQLTHSPKDSPGFEQLPNEIASELRIASPLQHIEFVPMNSISAEDAIQILRSSIFSQLSEYWQNVILSRGEIKTYSDGEYIIREGEIGDNFYVLLQGGADVIIGGKKISDYSPGDYFGERALITGEERKASIKATGPSKVVALNKTQFHGLINFAHIEGNKGENLIDSMTRIDSMRPIMLGLGIIDNLPNSVQQKLLESIEIIDYGKGETIIKEGDQGDAMYIIIQGNVDVIKNIDGGQRLLANLDKGMIFGEMALVYGGTRQASIIATDNCKLALLPKNKFDKICKDNPLIQFELIKLIQERKASTGSLIPVGEKDFHNSISNEDFYLTKSQAKALGYNEKFTNRMNDEGEIVIPGTKEIKCKLVQVSKNNFMWALDIYYITGRVQDRFIKIDANTLEGLISEDRTVWRKIREIQLKARNTIK